MRGLGAGAGVEYTGPDDPIFASLTGTHQDAHTSVVALLTPDAKLAWVVETCAYAIGALRAARDRGLAVPDDLLLVAGVDSQRASTSDPPITALDLHPADHAAAAVELLVARLGGEQRARTRSIKATLRTRRSTRSR